MLRRVTALIAVALCGCAGDPRPTSHRELGVEFAGCAGARRGPVCVRSEDGPLTLWIPGAADAIDLDLEATAVPLPEPTFVQGGVRVEVEVPAGTTHLTVKRRSDGARWKLRFEPQRKAAWRARAQELIGGHAWEQAAAWLESAIELAANDTDRGGALALLGQLKLKQGETAAGRDLLRESLPLLHRAGDLQVEFDKATVLIFNLITRDHDFAEARERLEALPRDWQAPGEVQYLDAYYHGLLAMETGDVRGALRHLETAAASARRTGSSWFQRVADEAVAIQLRRLGRHREAAEALASLLGQAIADHDPCRQAGLLGNLGLSALNTPNAENAAEDALTHFRRALELLRDDCTDDLPERQNAYLNLAQAELQAGRPAAARDALARAASIPVEPGVRLLLWWREIEGRLALSEGRPDEALALYESLNRMADAALAPEARWRAQIGIALARRASGDLAAAMAAFQASEQVLDAELLLVPVQEGRESFLAQRERATAHHLELLLHLGRTEDALALTRRARRRLLQHLSRSFRLSSLDADKRRSWERLVADYLKEQATIENVAARDWELAAGALEAVRHDRADARRRLSQAVDSALAALGKDPVLDATSRTPLRVGPGAVALVFHPLPEGWVVFAHRGGETRAFTPRCSEASFTSLASCLIRSARTAIAGASEIRILAAGALTSVDFQTLPFAQDVLLAQAPIVYDLDLGTATPDRAARSGTVFPRSVLILADPTGDLPRAREEATAVQKYLRPTADVTMLSGRAASVDAVAEPLARTQLLHFAGHASFAGRGGWQTYLPLADGGRLSLEHVLLLEHPPRWVVLSGCDTARTAKASTVANTIGLAQAFLAAGTETVIAAVRPVDDRLAADLVDSLYPAWLEGVTPAAALRQAQLALRRQQPAVDWSSFRLIER